MVKQTTNDNALKKVESKKSTSKLSNNKLQTKESGVDEVISLYPEKHNLIVHQVKKNHIKVLAVPATKQDNARIILSNVKVSNKMAEQQSVVNDTAASSHVAKQKNSAEKVTAKLPDQQSLAIVKQSKVSSNIIIVAKKPIDKPNLKLLQTSPVGKHTKPKQAVTNNEALDTKVSEKVMKQVNTSPVKTNNNVKKTNLPIIKHKNTTQNDILKANVSAVVVNDKEKNKESKQTVPPNDNIKFDIPRKKKGKTDLAISNESKSPPKNDVEVLQNINKNNKSQSIIVKKMVKTNDNNKNQQKKHSTIDEANAKRALVAKTQLFGNTVITDEHISLNVTTQSNKPNNNLVEVITPKRTIQKNDS